LTKYVNIEQVDVQLKAWEGKICGSNLDLMVYWTFEVDKYASLFIQFSNMFGCGEQVKQLGDLGKNTFEGANGIILQKEVLWNFF